MAELVCCDQRVISHDMFCWAHVLHNVSGFQWEENGLDSQKKWISEVIVFALELWVCLEIDELQRSKASRSKTDKKKQLIKMSHRTHPKDGICCIIINCKQCLPTPCAVNSAYSLPKHLHHSSFWIFTIFFFSSSCFNSFLPSMAHENSPQMF